MKDKTEAELPVSFRLLSVGIEQYAIHLPTVGAVVVQNIEVTYDFELAASERQITAIPRFVFKGEADKQFAILQSFAKFDVPEKDWQRLRTNSAKVVLPAYLLQHLAVIATGFARGVIYEKFSREAQFSGMMLPIIPVINYIQDDLSFDILPEHGQ